MKTIKDILKENNLSGFSIAVKGELKRYVVATTHNEFDHKEHIINIDLVSETLEPQVKENKYTYDNVTVGGWNDNKTDTLYIDAGMSTDDLDYALNVAKYNKQIAIWDSVEEKEIRV